MAAPRAGPELPAGLVELGSVRGSYGVRGWVRIAPHAADSSALGAVPTWWVIKRNEGTPVDVDGYRRHGKEVLAKWPGCESKEQADALKGAVIAVARSALPPLPPGEHYLVDLIGSHVVNREGDALGTVSGLRESDVAGTARQWLEVVDDETLRLIPLVEQYVDAVDTEQRVVRVDWQRDW